MRMSRSPQNGGFHSSTGGGPLPARWIAPVIASRPDCPSFAMVYVESFLEHEFGGAPSRKCAFLSICTGQCQTQAVFPVVFPMNEESAHSLRSRLMAHILHEYLPNGRACKLPLFRAYGAILTEIRIRPNTRS